MVSSQVLTILHEVFPAVKAAEMAVKFRPLWWEGWQTLGRAQLNLGEVDLVNMAGKKYSKWKQIRIWHARKTNVWKYGGIYE